MADPDLAYASLHEADSYMLYHLKKALWDRCTLDEKRAALVSATRSIDKLALRGTKKSANQTLRFPRNTGEEEIPMAVKEATIELAIALLDGIDAEKEYQGLSRISRAYGPVSQHKDTSKIEPHLAAGIPSLEAWRRLLPYIRAAGGIKLVRDS